ncbi:MAG TPA: PAS domain S-box protein, partial [Bryobacteraceae bacterium]|nr:PAS domain S-box protein [Bryobacteraceae bacterium]
AGVTGLCLVALAVLEGRGILPLTPGTMPDMGYFIDIAVILFITAMAASLVAEDLRSTLAHSRRLSAALQSLVSATTSERGDFFEVLATELSRALGAKYVMICQVLPGDPPTARSITFVSDGVPQRNIEYALAGTPCGDILDHGQQCFLSGVQQQFPADQRLIDLGVTSYMGTPLRSAAGRAIGLVSVMHVKPIESVELARSLLTIFAERAASEIERKRVVAALRESEQRYRQTLQNLGEGIVAVDSDDAFVIVNPAAERMFGVGPGGLAGRRLTEFIEPGILKWPTGTGNFELAVKGQDSVRRRLQITSSAQRGAHGAFLEHLAVLRDITASRQLEDQVRMMARALSSAQDCISICDPDDRILYVNAAFIRTYGYREQELLGQSIRMIHAEHQPVPLPWPLLDVSVAEPSWQGELWNRTRDGREFPISLSAAAVHDEQGRFVASIGVARDITQERAMQEQNLQAQKLEGIGRLAGGVAHDFNNLLTVINGYTRLLLDSKDDLNTKRSALQQIQLAGERAAELTQQLLTFSRKQLIQPTVVNLNDLVRESETMFRRIVGEDVHLITSLEARSPIVMADPGQLHQILMNLVVNSRDAMPNGGILRIEVAEVEVPATPAHPAGTEPGAYVLLKVSDNGIGMLEETRQYIFEPFFSTRGSEGTGLGLATVYGIVKQARGGIQVLSEPGHGTTFLIYLP